MAYQVLARRWRPRRFDEIVGQEHVTRTLANAIRAGRLAHGFLFGGPRGVGKTTTARILAKCLNCETAQDGPVVDPCDECTSCREIAEGVNLDVLEIDGASNRGIDEIRDLRENVRYAPSGGRAKVYIIDEVHMLTKEAFNALLKTLEEPPPGVYFVFATTEAHKVPATIRSRCQQYDFHRISAEAIATTLADLAKKEKFDVEPLALEELARQADGGLRDAQSLLDQSAAVGEGKVTLDAVKALLGEAEDEAGLGILAAVADGDTGAALVRLQDLLDRGVDPSRVALSLARGLRDLLVARTAPDAARRLGVRADLVERATSLSGRIGEARLTGLLSLASRTVTDLRRSARPRLTLEIALARMARLEDPGELADLADRLEALGARLDGGADSGPRSAPSPAARASAAARPEPAAPARASRRPARNAPPPADRPDAPPPPSEPPPGEEGSAEPALSAASPTGPGGGGDVPAEARRIWDDLLARVRGRKRMLGSFLEHGAPLSLDPESLCAVFDSDYYEGMVSRRENLALIQEELAACAGRPLRLRVHVGPLPAGRARGDAGVGDGPAGRRPKDILAENPGLSRIVHELDARLLPGVDPSAGGGA